MDASAMKNSAFGAEQLQFRGGFFNFFNHVNLGAPGLSVQAPNTFGNYHEQPGSGSGE